MTSRIKIVGVQFAANPDHEPETPMTAQENQRTIDLLTQLDRTRPRVTIKPEPTNVADKEALAVRLLSQKIGYVRNRDDYKSIAFAALAASGRGFFHARVAQVKISDSGNFYVDAATDNTPINPIVHEDRWANWQTSLPLFPMTEEMLMVDDAVMMLQELVAQPTLSTEEEDEVRGYTEALVSTGRHAMWMEAKEGMDLIVRAMESKDGEWLRKLSQDLEHLQLGLCTARRRLERRMKWWPKMLASSEAERCWREWLHSKGVDGKEATDKEKAQWLAEIETILANIPALANRQVGDETELLTRAYYTNIPLQCFRQLLTALVVRHRLQDAANVPQNPVADLTYDLESAENYSDESASDLIACIISTANGLDTTGVKDLIVVLDKFNYQHDNKYKGELDQLHEILKQKSQTNVHIEKVNDIHGNQEVKIGK